VTPTIVIVGAASRDLTDDDPRGWRLGGGVTYSALVTARLGVPTGALMGVDELSADAQELDLLRDAGVDLRTVVLDRAPVFRNIERPEGRLQLSEGPSGVVPPGAVPEDWLTAPGWILTPVAAELPDAWADAPSTEATVAVGWQGLLRELPVDGPVRHTIPVRQPIIARADIVGISRDDVDPSISLDTLAGHLHPQATLVVTQGDRGGVVMDTGIDGSRHLRHYPSVRARQVADATGAGDVFLAAFAAARIEPRLVGGRIAAGFDLLLAATAASLNIEGVGLHGVPDRVAVRERMLEVRASAQPGSMAPGD